MDGFIFLGYEFLATLGPLLIGYLIKNKWDRSVLFLAVFGVYVMMVFNVTGAGTLYDVFQYGLEWRGNQLNLIPFSQGVSIIGYVLNIILMVPFGFLVPMLFNVKPTVPKVMYSGVGLILLIEMSQLLNNRRADVDDLIMNTLGLVVGLFLWKVIGKKIQAKLAIKPINMSLLVVIGVLFLSRFVLYNDFGLAKYLYGF